jgi:putative glutamine amidotransferase
MKKAPLVGILCGRSPHERYSAHRGYVYSVSSAGGVPVILPAGPDIDNEVLAEAVDACQSIVATGGGDVDPHHHSRGEPSSSDVLMDVDRDRDERELHVVRRAIEAGKRVLGVCRGAQLLAVVGGGRLIFDLKDTGIDGHWNEERQYEPVHPVKAEAGSLSEQVLGSISEVNSIHHQAIADPGHYMRATAWSPDGVIEAIEGRSLLGVQWHPERLAARDARHLAPFTWVVGA